MGVLSESWQLLLVLAPELLLLGSLSGSRVHNSKRIFRKIGDGSEKASGGLSGFGGHVLLGDSGSLL